jgi:UDP-N-acetyl-D-glucosamine dehydrogenase
MKIAIIGLGYVGLPLGLRFAEAGVSVLGLDVDPAKVEALNAGRSYIKTIESDAVKAARDSGKFEASTDFSRVEEVEAILICVPTPLSKYREPDISYVLNSGAAIAPYLGKGRSRGSPDPLIAGQETRDSVGLRPKLVVLESTTYPGTTDTELREVLEAGSGLKAGEGFYLAYSPEREDPGRKDHSVRTIPKVMGGYTEKCLERCVELYSMAIDAVHPVASCRLAEATKLTENIFRSVNIALVNELKVVYHEMGINVWDVINAAATKPFGYMPFYPGPGLGGHCIPIDPFYLTWKAREYGQHTRFIELAGEINTRMPEYVINRVGEALNDAGKPVKGSRILILGLAYKPNVDDDRESPSYALMELLEERGAIVEYNDPFVPEIKLTREHSQFAGRKSVDLENSLQENFKEYDAILLSTNHAAYKDLDLSGVDCPLVDTRNWITRRPEKYYRA